MILNMPPMLVRKGALVELNVTDSITNKEVEQGQWLQLFQVMTSYYDRATSYAQMIAETVGDPTPFLQMAERALLVSDETLRRLLETYNIPDLDRFTLVEKPSAGAESGQNGQGAVNPGQTTNRLGGTVPTQGMGPVQGPS